MTLPLNEKVKQYISVNSNLAIKKIEVNGTVVFTSDNFNKNDNIWITFSGDNLPRSWNRYIMRHGEHVVLTAEAIKDKNIQLRISSIQYETYKSVTQQWENRTIEYTKHLRFKKNPDKFFLIVPSRFKNISYDLIS